MEVRELICIGCPLGCPLTVTMDGETVTVTGNTCKRGEAYGKKEVCDPTRTVTSCIRVEGGELAVVSVKTQGEVPKGRIFDVMKAIHATRATAPVAAGQVLLPDCAGTGVAVIATKDVARA